ncbi:MAG: hypothetical protein AAF862_07505 [Pseudomonadota bacterium]
MIKRPPNADAFAAARQRLETMNQRLKALAMTVVSRFQNAAKAPKNQGFKADYDVRIRTLVEDEEPPVRLVHSQQPGSDTPEEKER